VSAFLRRLAALLAGLLLLGAAASAQAFERGVDAYRHGDYAGAREHWRAALDEELSQRDRAQVYFDLGNACWRLEKRLEAIACYHAAVRLDPRRADARENLEFARAKAGLAPADTGDLGATVERALTGLRPGERRTLVFAALLLWALLLTAELAFGGAALRGGLVLASVGLALACLPWGYGLLRPERDAPMLVIDSGNVSLRSEPMEAREPIGELSALEEVEKLDELPGWVRVERADGSKGWVRAAALFALELGT